MGRGRSGDSKDSPGEAVTGVRREGSAGKSSSERRTSVSTDGRVGGPGSGEAEG